MSTNPTPASRRPAKAKICPTTDDITAILEAIHLERAPYTCERNLLMVLLLADCGLRLTELTRLKLHQVTTHNAIVTAIELRSNQCKRGYARAVPTSKRVQEAISNYIHSRHYRIESADQWLFLSRIGREYPISNRSVQKMLAYYSYRALGRRIHPHQLRHHAATKLLKVTNTRVVQKFLGHQRISTTEIYTHPDFSDIKAAFEMIGK